MSPQNKLKKDGHKVAIVQSTSLKGKELKQVLTERCFPISSLKLLDIVEYKGQLTHFSGEAKVVLGINEESFKGVEIAFFCGNSESTKEYLPWARRYNVTCIDLSQAMTAAENIPYVVQGINDEDIKTCKGIIGNPHPAAIIISTFFHSLSSVFPAEYAICSVFQPASEFGEEGINELYNQSINLLNFNKIPVGIFKKQLAFNLFPASILSKKSDAEEVENIIAKQINKILKQSPLSFTLRLIQTPTFHSYAILIFVRLKEEIAVKELQERLSNRLSLKLPSSKSKKELWPSPAEMAGNDDIYLGQIKKDGNLKASYWFWLVADNLRPGCALNAVGIAEMLIS